MTSQELKKLLKERGITPYTLARYLGVNSTTVLHWVNGVAKVPQMANLIIRTLFHGNGILPTLTPLKRGRPTKESNYE